MTKHQPPYVMGIDAGTEALKAALYDLKGNQIASGFILFGLPLVWIILSRHALQLQNTLNTTDTKDSL